MKIKNFLKTKGVWIIGFVLVFVLAFSKMVIGEYKISFTNLMYDKAPWDVEGVETSGPWLSDVTDSGYTSIYANVMSGNNFAFWQNTNALGGENNIGSILYPMKYTFLLPLDVGVFLAYFLEFFIAFTGMYFLLKRYEVGKFASAIGGILYTFSSVMVVWLGWPHSDVSAYAPFAFLLVHEMIHQIKLRHALLFSVVLWLMLMAGMPTYVAYYMYVMGVYIVVHAIAKYFKTDKKKMFMVWGLFALGVILGVLMSLPYTISLIQTVGSNGYADSRAYKALEVLDPDYLRTMVYPYFRNELSLHINESTIYFGLLPLILLPLTFCRIKDKKVVWFYGILAIVVGCLIFTHIFDGIFTKMPAINSSTKYRVIALFNFAMVIVGAVNLDDIIKNRLWYRGHWWVLGVVWLVSIVWFEIASEDIITTLLASKTNSEAYYRAAYVLLGILISLSVYVFWNKRLLLAVLFVAVAYDGAKFAEFYIPWIEKDAKIIPEATDSIAYMQENTDTERVIGIGSWTMFPNTNMYYGLYDLRAHNMTVTNKDIQEYYKAIDSTCYTSATRVAFSQIENYNLLRYLGLKFMIGEELGYQVDYGSISDSKAPLGVLQPNTVVQQEFEAQENELTGVRILFATYGKVPQSEDSLTVKVFDKESKDVVCEEEIPVKTLEDNVYRKIKFDTIEESAGRTYILQIETGETMGDPITVWNAKKDSTVLVNGEEIPGQLVFRAAHNEKDVYNIVCEGKDGMSVAQLHEYSDKAELSEVITKLDSEKDVLDAMKETYDEHAVFTTEELDVESKSLEENEYVEVLEYEADYIKLKYTANHDRMIIVNDYYTKDWHAYVDGKEVDIHKVNYLLRGVDAAAGDDVIVELKYETSYTTIYIAVASLIVFIGLFAGSEIMNYRKKRKATVEVV